MKVLTLILATFLPQVATFRFLEEAAVEPRFTIENSKKLSWADAQKACEDKELRLASIQSEEDSADIEKLKQEESLTPEQGLFPFDDAKTIWIGGFYNATSPTTSDTLHEFEWVATGKDNVKVTPQSYDNWDVGWPGIRSAKEDCMA